MVTPDTHLVKNHESWSKTIESQFKKRSPKLNVYEDRLQNSVLVSLLE